jgi:VIT1/CCC1 family predicted Fe2+/Mn2+ transporter
MMFAEERRRRLGRIAPPREGLLSKVLGAFLDPIDALFTIFFSILFALLFTLSYAVLIYRQALGPVLSGGDGRDLFLAILGAVAAWGIIDGVLYALGEVLGRRERYRLLQYVQTSENEEDAATAIADELDFILKPITSDEQRHALYHDMLTYLRQAEPQPIRLQRDDVVGAVATAALSILVVLPSLLPLLLLPDNFTMAIYISNVVSIVVIFATGYSWGIHTSTSPWKTGLLMASVCLAMVVIAALLGG